MNMGHVTVLCTFQMKFLRGKRSWVQYRKEGREKTKGSTNRINPKIPKCLIYRFRFTGARFAGTSAQEKTRRKYAPSAKPRKTGSNGLYSARGLIEKQCYHSWTGRSSFWPARQRL